MTPNFSRYKDLIQENLQHGKKSNVFNKAHTFGSATLGRAQNAPLQKLTLSDPVVDREFFDSLYALTGVAGKAPKYHQSPGQHPDFGTIKKTGQPEYHYIVSMFIDISKSTRLFAKYDPFVVANITTTIQRAGIHIAWYFDGYVQRYHGDGLLLYFGGKNTTVQQATRNAILAASVFTKFVKDELPDIFLEQGIDEIYTRIGIDVGDDDETLWHLAGMDQCSEVTTCCLHTSLAAHMQGSARRNGIMIGDNVKAMSNLATDLFSVLKDSEGKEDRYIFSDPEDNFYYTQWAFDWVQHLKNVGNNEYAPKPPASSATIGAPAILSSSSSRNGGANMDYLRQQASGIRPYYE